MASKSMLCCHEFAKSLVNTNKIFELKMLVLLEEFSHALVTEKSLLGYDPVLGEWFPTFRKIVVSPSVSFKGLGIVLGSLYSRISGHYSHSKR
jgi:hypothetical protein